MKKRAVIMLSYVLLALSCISCQQQPTEESEYEASLPSMIEDNERTLEMHSRQEQYPSSTETLQFVVENKGFDLISFGTYYQLEKWQNGDWYQVPFVNDHAFMDIGLMLESGQSTEIVISVEDFDMPLIEGEYRLIKSFYDDGQEHILAASFTIEEQSAD